MVFRQTKTKSSPNKQHVFLWIALTLVALGLIGLTAYEVTKGRSPISQAAQLSFTEDFSTTTYKDTVNTTATWNGDGTLRLPPEMTHYKADLKTLGADNIKPTTGVAFSFDYAVAFDSQNNPHVAWSDDVTGAREIYFAKWNPSVGTGGAWVDALDNPISDAACSSPSYASCPAFKITATGGNTGPSLALRSNDVMTMSWIRDISPAPIELYYAEWSGSDWVGADGSLGPQLVDSQVVTGSRSTLQSSLALKPNGSAGVTWDLQVAGNWNIYYTEWNPGINDWATAAGVAGKEQISFNVAPDFSIQPSLDFDSLGQAWASWEQFFSAESPNREIMLNYWDGVSWHGLINGAGPDEVTNNDTISFSVEIKINSQDNPGLVFTDLLPGDEDGFFIQWNPSTVQWEDAGGNAFTSGGCPSTCIYGPFVNFIVNPSLSVDPQLVFDSQDRPYVSWIDNGDGDLEIFASAWNGSAWTDLTLIDPDGPTTVEHTQVTTNSSTSVLLSMALDSFDRPGYVWGDNGSGNFDVFFVRELANFHNRVAQSLAVDQTDQAILSATLTLTGESQGYAGTTEPQPPVPFNSQGRNQFVDVDCSLSNDNGQNFFVVAVGQEFIFPTNGSTLKWRCELDSGTAFDNPVITELAISYTTGDPLPNLVLGKSVDTNGDGIYNDANSAVLPGGILTYQLTLANNGLGDAQDVVVTDQIPAGTTYVSGSTTLNGQPVADVGGTSPLVNGMSLGTVPGGTLFQTDWSGGPGQASFGALDRFDSQHAMIYTVPESLTAPVGELFYAGTSDQPSVFASDAAGRITLGGSIMLQDGRLFTMYSSQNFNTIFGRFFDKDGNALGPELTLVTGAEQITGTSAVQLSNGNIVISWSRLNNPTTNSEVLMQLLDSSGAPLSAATVVDSTTIPFPPSYPPSATDRVAILGNATTNGSEAFLGILHTDYYFGEQGEAFVVGRDGNLNVLFGPTQVDDTSTDLVTDLVKVAVNNTGTVAAFFPKAPAIFDPVMVSGHTISTAGVVTPGADVPIEPNALVGQPRALSSGNFLLGLSTFIAGQNQAQAIILSPTLSTVTPLTQLNVAPGTGNVTFALDEGDNRLLAAWQDAVSSQFFVARLFDLGLQPISDELAVGSGTISNPLLAGDPNSNDAWLVFNSFDQSNIGTVVGQLLGYEPQSHFLLSSVSDAGVIQDWTSVGGHAVVPNGTTLKIQVRTGNTALPDGSWSPFTDINYTLNGSLIQGTVPAAVAHARYLQYRIEVIRTNNALTPRLDDISFGRSGNNIITFQVRVTAPEGFVIANSASVTASNAPGSSTSNQAQNPVLPATSQGIAGETRITTAIGVSQNMFPQGGADCVVLARSDLPIDALPGSPLASQCNGSILLTPTDHLDSGVLAEMRRILDPVDPIYLLGQHRALAPNIEVELVQAGFLNLKRRGGPDRRATSAQIALELVALEPAAITRAAIANGDTFVDALSVASPCSIKPVGGTRCPILLVRPDELSAEVENFLTSHSDIQSLYVIGQTSVVSAALETKLRNLSTSPTSERLGGANRFATDVIVSNRFLPTPSVLYVANGVGAPVPVDALVAGPAAALEVAPIILVRADSVPDEIRDYLISHRSSVGKVVFIGGDAVIQPTVRQQVMDLLK